MSLAFAANEVVVVDASGCFLHLGVERAEPIVDFDYKTMREVHFHRRCGCVIAIDYIRVVARFGSNRIKSHKANTQAVLLKE